MKKTRDKKKKERKKKKKTKKTKQEEEAIQRIRKGTSRKKDKKEKKGRRRRGGRRRRKRQCCEGEIYCKGAARVPRWKRRKKRGVARTSLRHCPPRTACARRDWSTHHPNLSTYGIPYALTHRERGVCISCRLSWYWCRACSLAVCWFVKSYLYRHVSISRYPGGCGTAKCVWANVRVKGRTRVSTVVNSTTATQPHDRPDRYSKSELAGGTRWRRKVGNEQRRKRIGKRGSRHEPNCNQHPTRLDQHLADSFSFHRRFSRSLPLPLPFRILPRPSCCVRLSFFIVLLDLSLRWTRVHDETYVHGRPLDASTLLKIGLFSSRLVSSFNVSHRPFLSSSFFFFFFFFLHSFLLCSISSSMVEARHERIIPLRS